MVRNFDVYLSDKLADKKHLARKSQLIYIILTVVFGIVLTSLRLTGIIHRFSWFWILTMICWGLFFLVLLSTWPLSLSTEINLVCDKTDDIEDLTRYDWIYGCPALAVVSILLAIVIVIIAAMMDVGVGVATLYHGMLCIAGWCYSSLIVWLLIWIYVSLLSRKQIVKWWVDDLRKQFDDELEESKLVEKKQHKEVRHKLAKLLSISQLIKLTK